MGGAYTRGEQVAHYLTHGTGLAASIAALVLMIVFAAVRGESSHVITAVVFGVALIALYATFMNFRRDRATHWLQVLRHHHHAAIFLLIAGTATPFLLGSVKGSWGWSLFGVVWGLCAIGASCRLFGTDNLRLVSRGAYLGLGLVALIALKPLVATVPQGALWLLLAGALCYACGSVFHVWQRLRYHQVVRHAFALGGSACHLLALVIFVLPHGT